MVALFDAALFLCMHCLNVYTTVLRSGGSGYYDQQEMDLSLDALEDYVVPLDMSLMHNRYGHAVCTRGIILCCCAVCGRLCLL
jgi:hypothetical protein